MHRSKGGDSASFIHFIEGTNLEEVRVLIETCGWLGKSVVRARGNNTLFLVIQPADLATQEK